MRHRVKAKHFNRDSKGRKAMFKGLLSNLFEHGAIETTEARAKEMKRLADKLIYRAMPGTLQARRVLEQFFGTRAIVNHLVDAVAPAMKDRVSGFSRIVPLGRRRGDDATMVKLELVSQPLPKSRAEVVAPAKKTAISAPAEVTTVVESEVAEAAKPAPKAKAAAKPKKTASKKSE
jgi:large subunit ribosomal protein L17